MAKFTKLNIGDTVSSSSGRVLKKLSKNSDELAGSWLLNTSLENFGSTSGKLKGTAYRCDGTAFRFDEFHGAGGDFSLEQAKEDHSKAYYSNLYYGKVVSTDVYMQTAKYVWTGYSWSGNYIGKITKTDISTADKLVRTIVIDTTFEESGSTYLLNYLKANAIKLS